MNFDFQQNSSFLRRALVRIVLTVLVWITGGTASFTQMFSAVPNGKASIYRITDSATGEELFRYRVWAGSDGDKLVSWREDHSPDGRHSLTECIEGNGREQPATAWRRVSFAKTGKLTGSVFQISDPKLYPFLSRPLPPAGLEPFACFKGSLLDKAAIEKGR